MAKEKKMTDALKTREELLAEMAVLRQRVDDLERAEEEHLHVRQSLERELAQKKYNSRYLASREVNILDLKEEVNELLLELGREIKYMPVGFMRPSLRGREGL